MIYNLVQRRHPSEDLGKFLIHFACNHMSLDLFENKLIIFNFIMKC